MDEPSLSDDDDWWDPSSPTHPQWNCRCVLILLDCPWIDVIDMALYSEFGDTDPRLPEGT